MEKPKSGKVEIENLTRSTRIFSAYRADGSPDYDADIIVGDKNNTPELFANKRVSPSRKNPLGTVVVDWAAIEALPPLVRKVFDACLAGDPNRKIDGRPAPLAPSIRMRAA